MADSNPTSADTFPAPDHAPSLPDSDLQGQVENIVDALLPVRDFMRLLSDCASVNADNITDLAPESLSVTLQDLADHLADADRRCAALALCAGRAETNDILSRDIEAQSNAVNAVRQLLLTAHGAIGMVRNDNEWPQFDSGALAGTMQWLAQRIAGISTGLQTLVCQDGATAVVVPPHS